MAVRDEIASNQREIENRQFFMNNVGEEVEDEKVNMKEGKMHDNRDYSKEIKYENISLEREEVEEKEGEKEGENRGLYTINNFKENSNENEKIYRKKENEFFSFSAVELIVEKGNERENEKDEEAENVGNEAKNAEIEKGKKEEIESGEGRRNILSQKYLDKKIISNNIVEITKLKLEEKKTVGDENVLKIDGTYMEISNKLSQPVTPSNPLNTAAHTAYPILHHIQHSTPHTNPHTTHTLSLPCHTQTKSDPYPRVSQSDPYPRVSQSDPYPRASQSDPYPRASQSDPYPRANPPLVGQVTLHLKTFAYMHKHLLAVSSKADAALELAIMALRK